MGIAGFSQSSAFAILFAPFHSLCMWLNASPLGLHFRSVAGAGPGHIAPATIDPHRNRPVFSSRKFAPLRRPPVRIQGEDPSPLKTASASRLKIIREFDAGVHPASAGRMVISGRMADVCAELERMAQRETTSGHA
jgi:hypothetical protein